MDYSKHYQRLIDRARTRSLQEYTERHHVVPKCLGGSDLPENLVRLTPEEHYVAHQLLVKMYPGNGKLVHAAVMMCGVGKSLRKNKVYGWLKRKQSQAAKKRTGSKNGSYGTRWVNDGTKSFKVKRDEPLWDGWKEGRIFPEGKTRRKITEQKIRSIAVKERNCEFARKTFNEWKVGGDTIRNIATKYNRSHVSLICLWKTHIPEYMPS